MRCSKCRIELPDNAKFCLQCGMELPRPAPALERPLRSDQEHRRRKPERKHITALFCDLAGYSAMTEKLDPEEVKEITSRIFGRAKHVIAKYDGFIERIMGDAVLAFFGVPRAHEDDPIRAVQAAIEIHDLVKSLSPQYREKLEAPPTMHSGINTGLVVTADAYPEKGAHGVAGDAVNVASRLRDLAAPGEILVGRETYVRAKGAFLFEDLGFRKIKGRSDPVHIFRVIGTRPGHRSAQIDRMVSSELVGRKNELKQLELQVMKAVEGAGSVVNVIGEPGIGKSRLIAELKKREIMKRVNLLEGRAVSVGKNLSFHPIVDLLWQWIGKTAGDTQDTAFDKLEKAVDEVAPDERDEIAPFIAALMGMKLRGRYAERVKGIEGEALQKLIIKTVRDLVIKAAQLRPTVVVLEDLHWADTSSLELLEAVCKLVEKHRIVFINVFRPWYSEPGERTVKAICARVPGSYVEMQLPPLDGTESGTMIDNMLKKGALPGPLKASIIDRSGGNPFFLEEVVRSLIDDGAVERKNGDFQVTEKIEEVVIPPTINDVLVARIDRLEERTRDLVKIASVIGRSFFDRVVKDVADSIEDVDYRLAHLMDVQIIRARMRSDELEYRFKHALAQEAAYESILLQQRKRLHLRVAESMERVFRERIREFYGTLAYHHVKAESLEKAEEFLIKAGEEALKSAASNEALNYYRDALDIYRRLTGANADPEKVAMLEKNIASAFFNRGRYPDAVEHFDKALNYYWGELPKTSLSTAFRFTKSFMTFLRALYFPSRWFKKTPTPHDAEMVDLFYKKAQALVVTNPKRFFVEFFYFYGTIVRFDLTKFKFGIGILAGASTLFSFIGLSLRIARKVLDYAKPRLDQDDAKQLIVYDLMDTQHLFLKGLWNEITGYGDELVKRNLRIGETFWAAQHCYWQALPEIYRGRFDAARLMANKLAEFAEADENDIYHLLRYLVNIHLFIESRRIKEALDEVNRGIQLVRKNDWPQNALTMHSLEALIRLLRNEHEEAAKALDQADRIRSDVRAVPMQAAFFHRSRFEYCLHGLEAALGKDLRREAAKYRKDALRSGKLLVKTCRKAALYRTDAFRLMGVYKWLIHDHKGAFKWWHKAIREGEDLGARPQLARTYASMAVYALSVKGTSPEPAEGKAEEYLQTARTMFRELGLDHDLDALNSATGCMDGSPGEVRGPVVDKKSRKTM
ncbi:MAG: AAA family ATPase [Pseudomonadota bacterium]